MKVKGKKTNTKDCPINSSITISFESFFVLSLFVTARYPIKLENKINIIVIVELKLVWNNHIIIVVTKEARVPGKDEI